MTPAAHRGVGNTRVQAGRNPTALHRPNAYCAFGDTRPQSAWPTTSIGPFGVAWLETGRNPTAVHRAAVFPAFGNP